MSFDLSVLESIRTPVQSKKKARRGNYARNLPTKPGKGLWMKDAFDLVIAIKGCIYATPVISESDAKIEGIAEEDRKRVCNGCTWLEWNDIERYHCSRV